MSAESKARALSTACARTRTPSEATNPLSGIRVARIRVLGIRVAVHHQPPRTLALRREQGGRNPLRPMRENPPHRTRDRNLPLPPDSRMPPQALHRQPASNDCEVENRERGKAHVMGYFLILHS